MSNIRLKSVEIAAKVVATMEIENKSKALFDLAEQIYRYATPDICVETKPWYEQEINASMTNTNKE